MGKVTILRENKYKKKKPPVWSLINQNYRTQEPLPQQIQRHGNLWGLYGQLFEITYVPSQYYSLQNIILLMKYMNTWISACWPSADSQVHNKSPDIFDCVVFNGVRISSTVLVTYMHEKCWSNENKIHVELVYWQGFWSILLPRRPLDGDTTISIKVKPTDSRNETLEASFQS